MTWTQVYDPLHSWILSTLVAALPILVLFGMLAGLRVKPPWGAIGGAGPAVLVAVGVFGGTPEVPGAGFFFGGGFRAERRGPVLFSAVDPFDTCLFTGPVA